jgi:hypothetical protein
VSEARQPPRMRLLHASPQAPVVDVYIDGEPFMTGLAYGEVGDYHPISAERHTIRILPAGAGAQGRPLLDGHLGLLREAGDYTVLVLGEVRHLHTLPLLDTTSAPGDDQAKIRFAHASPDAPAVDVGYRHGPILFRQVAFDRATPFVELKSGMYDLVLRPTGEARDLMTLPDYTITAGNLYTLVAMGLVDGTPAFMVMPLVESFEMCLSAEPC